LKSKILLIEDDESFVNSVRLMLAEYPVEVVWAASGADGIKKYRENIHGFASIVVDYCLPDWKGSDVARHLRKLNPIQDILFATGHTEPEYYVDLLETGCARSFIQKGKPVEHIRQCILDSISVFHSHNKVTNSDDYSPTKAEQELKAEGIVGKSPALYEILKTIKKVRGSTSSILLIGESGSGKEVITSALVEKGRKLITISCAEFIESEHSLETRLFGYKKGSFTGAERDTPGLLHNAHQGIVFFDELQELSRSGQAKLLRLFQEGKYRPYGDHSGQEISIKFQPICAAKPEIWEMIKNGTFLEDLYHRVNKIEIRIPPLRERNEDIEPLVRHFSDLLNGSNPPNQRKFFRAATIAEMAKHSWSRNNVRELQTAVESMYRLADTDIIIPSDFENYLMRSIRPGDELVSQAIVPLEYSVHKVEFERIVSVLKRCRTRIEAASKLGISRFDLKRKMEKLGIVPESYLLGTQ
jgi:DNA-binding NtrC family response regulator